MQLKILVADDSDPVQKAIKIALSPISGDIASANSYVEALNHCRNNTPDLIIADAGLTGTDGPNDFQALVNTCSNASLLLLEGSFEPIDKNAFHRCGLKSFLKKPFTAVDLGKRINELLGRTETLESSKKENTELSQSESRMWDQDMLGDAISLDLGDSATELKGDSEIDFSHELIDSSLPLTEPEHEPEPNLETSTETLEEEQMSDENVSEGIDFFSSNQHSFAIKREPEKHSMPKEGGLGLLPSQAPGEGIGLDAKIKNLIRTELPDLIRAEMGQEIDTLVREYCREKFGQLAREVIREELKALSKS